MQEKSILCKKRVFASKPLFSSILAICLKTSKFLLIWYKILCKNITARAEILASIDKKNMPQLGIEPRTQGFSVRVFIKHCKKLKQINYDYH